MGTVTGIYVAAAAGAAVRPVESAQLVTGRGLIGDRYRDGRGTFSRWPGEGRAVSLIEGEALAAILAETGIDLRAGRSRRNFETRGLRLSDLLGRRFRVGTTILRGTRLCTECRYLERITEPGVFAALVGRGGLRADVTEGGIVGVGDSIEPI